jgi:hypothetical protein
VRPRDGERRGGMERSALHLHAIGEGDAMNGSLPHNPRGVCVLGRPLPSQLWAGQTPRPAASTSPCSVLATHSCTHGRTPHVVACAPTSLWSPSGFSTTRHYTLLASQFSGAATCSERDEPVTTDQSEAVVAGAVCRARGDREAVKQSMASWQRSAWWLLDRRCRQCKAALPEAAGVAST